MAHSLSILSLTFPLNSFSEIHFSTIAENVFGSGQGLVSLISFRGDKWLACFLLFGVLLKQGKGRLRGALSERFELSTVTFNKDSLLNAYILYLQY